MSIKNLASQIIEASGGKSNIAFITNCMTRMRVKVTTTRMRWIIEYLVLE